MIRSIRNRALAAILLSAGIGQAWAETPSPYGANQPRPVTSPILPDDAPISGPPPVVLPPVTPTTPAAMQPLSPPPPVVLPPVTLPPPAALKPETVVKTEIKIIMVREPGRPDRKCLLTDQKKLPNGSTVYVLKALDNGEIMTISHDPKGETQRTDDQKSASAPSDLVPPTPGKPMMPTAQPAQTAKPESEKKPGFMKRLFSKEPVDSKPKPPVAAMPPSNPVLLPALPIAPERPMAPVVATAQALDVKVPESNNPGVAKVDLRTSLTPVAVKSTEPPLTIDPSSVSQASVGPMPRSLDPQAMKVKGLMESLKNGELPSLRMIAAEDLLHNVPGHMEAIRGALLTAAEEDEAGCVRAACIRCLSKLGTRDESFRTLLESAQDDSDEDVREEAEYAIKKLAVKK